MRLSLCVFPFKTFLNVSRCFCHGHVLSSTLFNTALPPFMSCDIHALWLRDSLPNQACHDAAQLLDIETVLVLDILRDYLYLTAMSFIWSEHISLKCLMPYLVTRFRASLSNRDTFMTGYVSSGGTSSIHSRDIR